MNDHLCLSSDNTSRNTVAYLDGSLGARLGFADGLRRAELDHFKLAEILWRRPDPEHLQRLSQAS
jgi:hypothetical protein